MAVEPAPPAPTPPGPFLHTGTGPNDWRTILPKKSFERLRIVRRLAEEASALVPHGEDMRAASVELQEAKRQLQRMLDPPGMGGHGLHEDDVRVRDQREHIVVLGETHDDIKHRYQVRGDEAQVIRGLLANTEAMLRQGTPPGIAVEEYDGKLPALNGKEPLPAAIARLRQNVTSLKAELARIEAASLPLDDVLALAVKEVEELASRGRPDFSSLMHGGRIGWPELNTQVRVHNVQAPAIAFAQIPDLALLVWLNKSALVQRITEELGARDTPALSLSVADREVATAKAAEALLLVERQEAAAMFRAWHDGLSLQPRPDLAPLAVLNLQLASTAASKGGTTLGYAYDIVVGR